MGSLQCRWSPGIRVTTREALACHASDHGVASEENVSSDTPENRSGESGEAVPRGRGAPPPGRSRPSHRSGGSPDPGRRFDRVRGWRVRWPVTALRPRPHRAGRRPSGRGQGRTRTLGNWPIVRPETDRGSDRHDLVDQVANRRGIVGRERVSHAGQNAGGRVCNLAGHRADTQMAQ